MRTPNGIYIYISPVVDQCKQCQSSRVDSVMGLWGLLAAVFGGLALIVLCIAKLMGCTFVDCWYDCSECCSDLCPLLKESVLGKAKTKPTGPKKRLSKIPRNGEPAVFEEVPRRDQHEDVA